ncbi:hypothetical protein TIFTF001_006352 [Ficus carica]|uniref:Uncharacterized protein n=1 Tax=Ficus carica TaxID=3494 RepID=A0AA87ZMQ4_FICCA|nr:hypothetical protein TIFTF001_006352 [Ficus carica]
MDECENYIVRVLKEKNLLEEHRCWSKEQDREVMQHISFDNRVSLDDMDLVFDNDSFYVIDFFFDVFAVFYLSIVFQYVNLIMEVVSPPFALIICLSDPSVGVVLVPLELLLCRVRGDFSATKSWLSIDRDTPSIIGVLSKRTLHVLDFSVPRYVPIIEFQSYSFPFKHH